MNICPKCKKDLISKSKYVYTPPFVAIKNYCSEHGYIWIAADPPAFKAGDKKAAILMDIEAHGLNGGMGADRRL
jgi:hypothetical protein